MRILAIQDYLRTGGTESQFLDLTARWAACGHDVSRLLFRRGGDLLPIALRTGPPPRFLQPVNSPWNWWAPGLKKLLRQERPDRVICFGRNAHWSLSRCIRDRRIPGLVATLRTGRNLPAGYRRILGAADAVVANSQFAARMAERQGADSRRIRVVENGCRLANSVLPERTAARAELGVEDGVTILLCLSSFVPGKAQERLLEIWAQLDAESRSRIRLWFVGGGPRKARLEAEAKRLPHCDQIQFWGNRNDPQTFLAAADAMVSVSREESSPNALVEGLWTGLPLAAYECAGVAELIVESAGGLLVPNSQTGQKQMADWIRTLPSQGDFRRISAAKYQNEARIRFNPQDRADEYLSIFKSLNPFSPRNP